MVASIRPPNLSWVLPYAAGAALKNKKQSRNIMVLVSRLVFVGGWGGGKSRTDGEFGVGRCKLLHLEQIRNGVLEFPLWRSG